MYSTAVQGDVRGDMGAQKQRRLASPSEAGVFQPSLKSHDEGMGQREMAQCSRQKAEQVSRPDLYKEAGETEGVQYGWS